MNRLISTNLQRVTPEALPPARREGPARVLFVHGNILGFKSVARMLKKHCEHREDVDAVHIDLAAPGWMKALGKSAPVATRGWDFHSLRYLHMWGAVMGRWFRGPLPLDRFDAVHLMTQGNAYAMLRARPRCAARFAVNIDGTARQDVDEFGFSPIARAPFIRAERRMFGAADLIVCRNGWAPRSLRKDFCLPEERIHVARNSIETPEAHRWDERGREHGGLPRIVFVGNQWKRKGGDLAVRIHQQRFADRAELHVFSQKPSVDRSAKNVVWHGFVDRDELMNTLLPSMDVFLLPSREDMLPWAALEAASIGLPVVAANVGAMGEVVVDGETGVLCDPGPGSEAAFAAALERLLGDAALRERMGRAGREHIAKNHNPDATYPALIDRLVALADAPRRADGGSS